MSGIIVEWINRLFPKKECRVLFIGLDAAGKTTILYKLKLGEVVNTIPTIGFNVETITHKGMEITAWDVGGCDKIRPLWRHYYQNTDALVLVVDSNDRERMGGNDHNEKWSTVQGLFIETLKADELRNCKVLIYLNKQDLPHAMTPAEFKTFFNIDGLIANRTIPPFHYHIQPCCACAGDGLYEGLDWLVHAVTEARDKKPGLPSAESADPPPAPSIESEVEKEKTKSSNPQENLLSEWLEREDDPDEIFLEKLANYTLDSWDHYTHLRIAWLFLQRLGRREGMSKIFKSIRLFIENSPRTRTNPSLKEGEVPKRGTTFHETMTYFWMHMVHYAMAATILPENTFKVFLLMNPQLCNGGLFLTFYSKKHILFNPTARAEVVLPDLKPLPSIIPSPSNTKRQVVIGEGVSVASLQKNIGDLSDEEFYNLFELHQLTAFGHEVKMRIIYLLLCRQGRGKGGTDTILRLLEDFEGKIGFHLTINYFWIQLISFHIMNLIAQSKKGKGDEKKWKKENFGKLFDSSPLGTVSPVGTIIPFAEFFKEKTVEDLHDSLLYQK